ncbi:TetR/AcrR family transcriptional regulator [Nonomuraea insulae]|uniref:TetR/AcrR family transcriptional regulator n=1 Tax=Nonomuraea insulae TaxID=1616787 RepID=A0ABW1CZW4_9ACTN
MNDRSTASNSRDAVYAAALEAFAEKGFHGASMRDIARRAGVVLSNLYHYADSKSDLLVELLKKANYDHLSATEWALTGADASPRHRLEAAVKAYVGYIVDHPMEALIAHSELRYLGDDDRKRLVMARDRVEALFDGIIEDGVRAGTFTTSHSRGVTRAVLTMCAGIAQWYRQDGRLSREDIAGEYADYALALVGSIHD